MISRFQYGQKEEEREIHQVNWYWLCIPKREGGLGCRDFHYFNQAILAKQGWRLLNDEASLFRKVLKAKYFPNDTFLQSKIGHNPSFTWRSIQQAKQILEKGYKGRVGDESKVKIWANNWLTNQNGFKVWTTLHILLQEALVQTLIDSDSHDWNHSLIDQIFFFLQFESKEIKSIPLT